MSGLSADMSIESALGSVIRRIRKEMQLSQNDLALNSNLDRSYISQVESGKKNLTIVSLFNFANGLNVSPQRILREVEALIAVNEHRSSRSQHFVEF